MRAPAYVFPTDAALAGKKVVVLGLGLYHGGAAVCRFLHRLDCRIVVTDLRDAATLEESLAEIADIPCELALGGHRDADLDDAAFVAVNPAIPADAPFLLEAVRRDIPLVSEVGLFFSRLKAPFVLVTGSKGKTTTTALLHSMAERARRTGRAILGGNIGKPLLDRVHEIDRDAVVIFEVSSFQLEQLRGLARAPQVCLVTNIFPVHIDRHGTFDDYKAAKREVLSGARCAVLNADDAETRALGAAFPGTVSYFSTSPSAGLPTYSLRDARLVAPDGSTLLERADLRIPGLHNVSNALAAFAAADVLGVPRDASAAAAREFCGVEHRLERVAEKRGVRYVNDSIATTPQSAIAALEALAADGSGVLLIAGGKESPFELGALAAAAIAKAKGVFAIGESGERLVGAIAQRSLQFPARYVGTLEAAMSAAEAAAAPGDVIALSPSFPSFDQFRNFKDRGDAFKRLARRS